MTDIDKAREALATWVNTIAFRVPGRVADDVHVVENFIDAKIDAAVKSWVFEEPAAHEAPASPELGDLDYRLRDAARDEAENDISLGATPTEDEIVNAMHTTLVWEAAETLRSLRAGAEKAREALSLATCSRAGCVDAFHVANNSALAILTEALGAITDKSDAPLSEALAELRKIPWDDDPGLDEADDEAPASPDAREDHGVATLVRRLDTAEQTIADLTREREEVRGILAGADYPSLPNDWTLAQVAQARMDDIKKYMDQVRHTCARAEKAEAEIAKMGGRGDVTP